MADLEYPPGSEKAIEAGCECPVMDNSYGQGWMGTDDYIFNMECPLHGERFDERE